ncbi:enoyl-CoA hydratase/isomerase family protein [Mesorhizobium sp. VK25A]|uniref:Enoyl-CoA hydratase/isomerase family protein n=1 Tax=Mesorhizobium vachelliae TaxID=3072309 RepID=A0ABU5AF44_9HYPH|nr:MULTISPECIES: enoyl-CoA hydratase/isomerase family protein [unclassified Mesorhizobium]MDX8535889.1 enoyl-CoA hydratase/isomerase family protein [Mesorhizobium sp. VK25D]MDX8548643.1 enoyl-CoA hydratase/isomerase family protein [Mesorhizobium sp. VK25A]
MPYETIIYTRRDAPAEIRFNRSQRLNAVVEQFCHEVLAALHAAEDDDQVRVIVLTGEGRAFCVGADLKEHGKGERTPRQQRDYLVLGNEVCRRIQCSRLPVVAAVNGFASGAGAEMAISSDFILMKESALLWLPEVSIGTFIGGGVSGILPRLVGLARARELIMTDRRVNGREAAAIGLALRAFDDEKFEAGVDEFVQMLASKAPLSMRFAKEHLNDPGRSLEARLITELESLRACMVTADWQEGVDDFAEKRRPVFTGR